MFLSRSRLLDASVGVRDSFCTSCERRRRAALHLAASVGMREQLCNCAHRRHCFTRGAAARGADFPGPHPFGKPLMLDNRS